jgi:very-short-patch-repair endonuclease
MNNADYDKRRAQYLESKGFKVVRFWNNDMLNKTDSVLDALTLTLSQRERE